LKQEEEEEEEEEEYDEYQKEEAQMQVIKNQVKEKSIQSQYKWQIYLFDHNA